MAPAMIRLLLTGVSTRAAAESAARAGFDVTAVDAYADIDQHQAVRALCVPRKTGVPFSAMAAARMGRDLPADAVAYLSNVDNHPRAVTTIASGRQLWGNRVEVLRRVRDPFDLAATLARHGFSVPRVSRTTSADDEWLLKPLRSGGGHGVRRWRGHAPLLRGTYLQQFLDGVPGSIVFVAAAGRAHPLGMSRQLVGDPDFGAHGFRYCGSILAPADRLFDSGKALFTRARRLMNTVAAEYGLVGVNGIDFIAREGVPWAIEVNPRWCASMELVERAGGVSVFAAHANACREQAIVTDDLVDAATHHDAVGKAIVYARSAVTLGDTRTWLGDPDVRDVPRPGERIRAGAPICTVFAQAPDVEGCRAALAARAGEIYARVARWQQEAA
jgi:predicted ATP-grasp superfamily ATP-dependent carboligase